MEIWPSIRGGKFILNVRQIKEKRQTTLLVKHHGLETGIPDTEKGSAGPQLRDQHRERNLDSLYIPGMVCLLPRTWKENK